MKVCGVMDLFLTCLVRPRCRTCLPSPRDLQRNLHIHDVEQHVWGASCRKCHHIIKNLVFTVEFDVLVMLSIS